MKTALITFHTEGKSELSEILDVFSNCAIELDTLEILSLTDDLGFRRRVEEFKDTADTLLILDNENLSFDIRKIISEVTDTTFVENERAKSFAKAVAKERNEEYLENFSLMPIEASVIPNLAGKNQGFILDQSDFTLVFLPNRKEEFKPMFLSYVVPFIENKFNLKSQKLTLKYFGDKNTLLSVLKDNKENFGFDYRVQGKYDDYTVTLFFNKDIEEQAKREAIREVVKRLKDNIYAEFDTTLSERLFDILKLKKLKLSIAESFTGGRVVFEMIKNSGVSEFLNEGIVSYSNQSKKERLFVSASDLQKEGAVSSIVAYEMAVGLLRTKNCNVAIATTGIAGPKSDDTNKPIGLCYIAVGTINGVHTYKFNFTGNREDITETAKNTALFLAIKNLKNI